MCGLSIIIYCNALLFMAVFILCIHMYVYLLAMISIIKVTYKVYTKYFTKSIRENITYNCNVRTICH